MSITLLSACLGLAGVLTLSAPRSDEALAALNRLIEVYEQVQGSYVRPVDAGAAMDAAVRGMVKQLDPYSEVLTPQGVARFYEDTRGAFGGVGLEIILERARVVVITPLEGGPAEAAGIRPRDQIVAVDGVALTRANLLEVVDKLRGPPGSEVTLKLRREGRAFTRALRREEINIEGVSGVALGGERFLIRVRVFQAGVAARVRSTLYDLGAFEAEAPAVILDLRGNPGGLLREGVALADLFLSEGEIVRMEGRDPHQRRVWEASATGTLPAWPVAVLVDDGSASASEIVAGALQDRGRALLVGQTSFGKGSVQRLFHLKGGYGLKLTVARYLTPSGRDLHERGIDPDLPTPAPAQRIRPKLPELPALIERGRLDDPALLRALNALDLGEHAKKGEP